MNILCRNFANYLLILSFLCIFGYARVVYSEEKLSIYADISEIFGTSFTIPKYSFVSNSWAFDLEKKLLFRGHVGGTVTFCPEDSAYICINSAGLQFAVPKNHLPASWKYGGIEYHLINSNVSINILGQQYALNVITNQMPLILEDISYQLVYKYFYSQSHGLIGFTQSILNCENIVSDTFEEGDSPCNIGGTFILKSGEPLFKE